MAINLRKLLALLKALTIATIGYRAPFLAYRKANCDFTVVDMFTVPASSSIVLSVIPSHVSPDGFLIRSGFFPRRVLGNERRPRRVLYDSNVRQKGLQKS